MCGIAGIYCQDNDRLNLPDISRKMLNKIQYRGPDDKKIVSIDNFSAGVARLSIESLKYGEQPVEDSKYIIGFNGEIFNYKELIDKYQLNSRLVNSEAKLILSIFQKKYVNFISELQGQFAIFVFDKEKQELLLFRDRYGIRPVFYYFDKKHFLFSSEIKSIVASNVTNFSINHKMIEQISIFWTGIGNTTALENVNQLEHSCYLRYHRGRVEVKKYHINSVLNIERSSYNTDSYSIYDLLEKAVKNQIHGEVGYACYLSGGIDSSALAYILHNLKDSQLETFSLEFEDKQYDESKSQLAVSQYLNTKHHSLRINGNDIASNFEKVINHCETVLFRTAPIPLYLLSKFVKESGHKVVYTGEGADEILLGYDIFFENRIRKFWSRQPSSKFRGELLKKIYNYLPQFKDEKFFRASKFFYRNYLNVTDDLTYSHLVRWAGYKQISKYFKFETSYYSLIEEFKKTLPKDFSNYNLDRKAQFIEMETLLSGYILSSQGDRVSMANSVEGRYPFLDENFTEGIGKIQTSKLAYLLDAKSLFRKNFINKLPLDILNRPKQAYQSPNLNAFFNDGNASDPVVEFMDNLKNLHFIDQSRAQKLYNIGKFNNEMIGSRDNMAFIMMMSYYFLTKSLYNWSLN